ncbi:MAG: DegV family EDD domain-containing protein [FCB group bacterium]|nr:DegV family EDD domain-containing protein [FCB group bacterium]
MLKSNKKQKIKYLDGIRFRVAFIAGAQAIINDKAYLNKINVFPVPDADTGTNLASTVQAMAADLPENQKLNTVLEAASDSGLMNSRGNSGIIFAQFIFGLYRALSRSETISLKQFSEAVTDSVGHVYTSLANPVEGTVLTVMRVWSEKLAELSATTDDFEKALFIAYQEAAKALEETPRQLEVLAKAGVVDSGAKGFVDLLAGIVDFMSDGDLRVIPQFEQPDYEPEVHQFDDDEVIEHRYCTEALLSESPIDFVKIKREAENYGDSVVVAGSPKRLRLHIHTNRPDELFDWLRDHGELTSMKADDMVRQFEVSHKRKFPIALVTDSACDLPDEILEKYQINVIPFTLNFGENSYLDKLTITPEKFYQLLETGSVHPTTAQPSPALVNNQIAFLKTHYKSVICVHISSQLSGVCNLAQQAAKAYNEDEVFVIDSRQLSVSEGLIVYRIAQAIEAGKTVDEIKLLSSEWIDKTEVFVDVATLKYMVRGGRVSPAKGMAAKLLNLKPIVSLDKDGKGIAFGKSFSRQANMKKIIKLVSDFSDKQSLWNYAIVHAKSEERANEYAEHLQKTIGFPPLYIQEISPVIGAHNGIGVVGIGLMSK